MIFFLFILNLNAGEYGCLNNRRHVCSSLFPLQYTIHTDDTDGNNNIKRPQILNRIFHALRRIRRRWRYDTFARTHLTKTSPFHLVRSNATRIFERSQSLLISSKDGKRATERKRMKEKKTQTMHSKSILLHGCFGEHLCNT